MEVLTVSNNENNNYKDDVVVVGFDDKDGYISSGNSIDETDSNDPMLETKVHVLNKCY